MFNVKRINSLDTQPMLMLLTKTSVHLFNNFKISSKSDHDFSLNHMGQVEGDISVSILSPYSLADLPDNRAILSRILFEILKSEHSYKHIDMQEIYTILKRRYKLKKTALELSDTHGESFLFACASERELELVLRIMMDSHMPSCILQRYEGITTMTTSYESINMRYMNQATKLWLKGEMSNFDYLMHLNVAAGRSFQDLTSYPVFPWIIADYKSENLDLTDPNSFRDLSKPMGAIGEKRAAQFKERYDSLNDFGNADSPPAFFYGTHYSCTGYVLHYLMRMKPYTYMAISHQGGQFDKADRLFRSVESCWTSASQENLQDVRELIPEFFCLPEFLVNFNKFDFGLTQNGEAVDDVALPPWAKGSAEQFIRIHRMALESKYVSENLHSWIDLIFGYKQ